MSDNTTTLDSLDASLNALVKAADATSTTNRLKKGDGINMEGGKGDNFAKPSDAGALDDMMIAKMTAAGFTPEQASAMVAFAGEFFTHDRPSPKSKMRGKAGGHMEPDADERGGPSDEDEDDFGGKADGDFGGDDEGEEDEEEDEEEAPVGKRRGKRGLAKSFSEQFGDDSDISDAVDVSPFLEAIASRTSNALDSLNKSLRKSEVRQSNVNKAMANAIVELGKLTKSQARVISVLGERLGVVERTPAQPRGVTNTMKPLTKSMPGEAGVSGELRKSEVVATLSYMNLEKGIREIAGQKTSDLIVKAEAGSVVDPGTLAAVKTFLRTHPNEAEVARQYA